MIVSPRRKKLTAAASAFILLLGSGFPSAAQAAATAPSGFWAQELLAEWNSKGLLDTKKPSPSAANEPLVRAEVAALINNSLHLQLTDSSLAFGDISTNAWYAEALQTAAAAGYMNGYPTADGTVLANPDQKVTRQEAAVLLARAFGFHLKEEDIKASSAFKDSAQVAPFAQASMGYLLRHKILTGYDDKTLRPLQSVTLAEMAALLNRTAGQVIQAPQAWDKTVNGNVTLHAASSTISGLQINGDLYISLSAGAPLVLDQIRVSGNLRLLGAAGQEIAIRNSSIGGEVLVHASGAALLLASDLPSVRITGNAGSISIEGGTIGEVSVSAAKNSKPTLIDVAKEARVNRLGVYSDVHITGGSQISSAEIYSSTTSRLDSWPQNLKIENKAVVTIQNQSLSPGAYSASSPPAQGTDGSAGGAAVGTPLPSYPVPAPVPSASPAPSPEPNPGEEHPSETEGAEDSTAKDVQETLDLLFIPDVDLFSDIALPIEGVNGTLLSWHSSNEAFLSSRGVVNRPAVEQGDVTVLLTATASKGEMTLSKSYSLSVKAWKNVSITSLSFGGYNAIVNEAQSIATIFYPSGTSLGSNSLVLRTNLGTIGTVQASINGLKIENTETIPLANEQTLRLEASDGSSREYRLILKQVDSGIPTVTVNTYGQKIDRYNEITAHLNLDDSSIRPYGQGLYSGEIQLKGRGNSSWSMPKQSFAMTLSKKQGILDMPKDDDWVLIANYADKTLLRNDMAYLLGEKMDALKYSPRMRPVELFLNGTYWGSYLLGEKIKIAEGRLDLNKMSKDDTSGTKITGGYIIEKDWMSRIESDDNYFQTDRVSGEDVFVIKKPGSDKTNPQQLDYIAHYFKQAESALYSESFADPIMGYAQYFDVDSVIDWYLMNEWFKNVDAAMGSSVYFFKDKNQKLAMGPLWDFDIGAGNNDDLDRGTDPTGFYIQNAVWFSRFFEDPAFKTKVAARWSDLLSNQLKDWLLVLDQHAQAISSSAAYNFERWPILGTYVWPSAPGFESRTTYVSEVDYLRDFLTRRAVWMTENLSS